MLIPSFPPRPPRAQVQAPLANVTAPLQMMVANIDYDTHLGRIAVGRVVNGTIKKGQQIAICNSLLPGVSRKNKISELYVYDNFSRVFADEVRAA